MSVSELFAQALAHHQAGRLPQAEQLYRQILAADPGHAHACHNLGLMAVQTGHPDAIPLLRHSLVLQPGSAMQMNNLAAVLTANGQFEEATNLFRRAVQTDPALVDAHYNLAFDLLLHGHFDEGWREWEWRWKMRGADLFRLATDHPQLRWDGGPLPRRGRLLLHVEQGLGDTLQFSRYLPLAAARAPQARLTLLCNPPLVGLVQRSVGPAVTVTSDLPWEGFDAWHPLMSLPLLCGTRADNIPPPLRPVPDRKAAQRWGRRLVADGGRFRVGLVWAGSADHPRDRFRSMELAALAPLAEVGNVAFYSLQRSLESLRAASLPALGMRDFSAEWESFDDTAAFVANLDLVISVDTAVAHLAASMGKPAWILLPFVPDWRWQLDREDSQWYPTARLFRQTVPGDWTEVVGRVARALALAAVRPDPAT